MQRHKIGARAEYRQKENLRIMASPNLAERFSNLKSLKVDLSFYSANGIHRTSEIKYSVNLANAKSVFSFTCPNNECVGGDFDLSDELVAAIAAKSKIVEGEKRCRGWMNKTTIDSRHCDNLLRYKLTLGY